MKKFLLLTICCILFSTTVMARPHFGYHRPPRPHYEYRHNPAPVLGFAAGLVGDLLAGGYYYHHRSEPQTVYVPVQTPPQSKVCTSTVVNGAIVQNCVAQPIF